MDTKKNKKQEKTREKRKKQKRTRGDTAYIQDTEATVVCFGFAQQQCCDRFSVLHFSRSGRLPMPNRVIGKFWSRALRTYQYLLTCTATVQRRNPLRYRENERRETSAPTSVPLCDTNNALYDNPFPPPPYCGRLCHGVQGFWRLPQVHADHQPTSPFLACMEGMNPLPGEKT